MITTYAAARTAAAKHLSTSSSAARESQRHRLHRRNRQAIFEKEFGAAGGKRRRQKAPRGDGTASTPSAEAVGKSEPKAGGTSIGEGGASSASGAGSGSGSGPNFFSQPLAWYATKLETHPFTTKCLTSGVIAASGDLLCQYLVHRNESKESTVDPRGQAKAFQPDLIRTGRFGILGLALVAPVVHLWYGTLMTRFPGTTVSTVLKRTFFDQAFFAPIFLPTFMLNLMMLEGRPFGEVSEKLEKDLPGALVTNWCLWIPAMLVNFRYVPGRYQVLYSNMVGFVWNTYLSWKTQDSGEVDVDEAVAESRM